jgi:hypothetical protein
VKAKDAAAGGSVAAAACVACCAPPIIAALGVTAGVAATVGVFLGLAATITVAVFGIAWITGRRLRHRREISPRQEPVPVGPPVRRLRP